MLTSRNVQEVQVLTFLAQMFIVLLLPYLGCYRSDWLFFIAIFS